LAYFCHIVEVLTAVEEQPIDDNAISQLVDQLSQIFHIIRLPNESNTNIIHRLILKLRFILNGSENNEITSLELDEFPLGFNITGKVLDLAKY
jgi:hypothetical protein